MSKVFERLMYRQIDNYMNDKLSLLLTAFRKNHNTQHCLLAMFGKWITKLGKGQFIGAVFMDFSKAFDSINHNLLVANLEAGCKAMVSQEFLYNL